MDVPPEASKMRACRPPRERSASVALQEKREVPSLDQTSRSGAIVMSAPLSWFAPPPSSSPILTHDPTTRSLLPPLPPCLNFSAAASRSPLSAGTDLEKASLSLYFPPALKKTAYPRLEPAGSPRLFSAMRSMVILALCVLLTFSLQTIARLTPAQDASAAQENDGHSSFSYLAKYTAPSAFPTSAFSSYYQPPSGTTVQPRPAITNGIPGNQAAGDYFPDQVAAPSFLPTGAPSSEAVYPLASASPKPPSDVSAEAFAAQIQQDISTIIDTPSNATYTNCTRCVLALQLGQKLARAYPQQVPGVLVDLCKRYKGGKPIANQACERQYAPS
ncbi:hypothetical protein K437DRAFT_152851, partial [Tilletiaria anomala UBC 951]